MSNKQIINATFNINLLNSVKEYTDFKEIVINPKALDKNLFIMIYTINFRIKSYSFINYYQFNLSNYANIIDNELDDVVYNVFKYRDKIDTFITEFDDGYGRYKLNPYKNVYFNAIKSPINFKIKIEKLSKIISNFNVYKYDIDNYDKDNELFLQIVKLKLNNSKNKSVTFNINNIKIVVKQHSYDTIVFEFMNLLFSFSYIYRVVDGTTNGINNDMSNIQMEINVLKLLTLNNPNVLNTRLLNIKKQSIEQM